MTSKRKLSKGHFTEEQRDDICTGHLCPVCFGNDLKKTECDDDGINAAGYECRRCGEDWDGY